LFHGVSYLNFFGKLLLKKPRRILENTGMDRGRQSCADVLQNDTS